MSVPSYSITQMVTEQLTLGDILEANVQHGIVERPAHEELQTQVVDPLTIGEGLALLGTVPFQDQAVAEGQAGGRVGGRLVAVEHAASQRRLDMTNHLVLELILVLEAVDLVLGPCLTLWLGNRSCKSC